MTCHAGNVCNGSAFLIDLHLIWPLKPGKPPMGWPEAKTHTLTLNCMRIQKARRRCVYARGIDLERWGEREKEGKSLKRREKERRARVQGGEGRESLHAETEMQTGTDKETMVDKGENTEWACAVYVGQQQQCLIRPSRAEQCSPLPLHNNRPSCLTP